MLIFQGKYEKGKKIEGKEYKSNNVCFIGKYKNNLKYEGKTLNKNAEKIFEGKFNKGLFWTGKFYDPRNFKNISKIEMGIGSIFIYNFDGFSHFIGEYKDGLKLSGKEYNESRKKIFEGEYRNNLRWNGKFYSPDQTEVFLIEEGNGNIEEYNINKELIFKGELKNGYRYCGFGKEYYKENGNLKLHVQYKNFNYIKGFYFNIKGFKEFQGTFKEEKKLEGILYQEKDMGNSLLFSGEFNKGKKHKGIEITSISAFIGEFDEKENYLKGKYYEGHFDLEEKKELFRKYYIKEINIEESEKNRNIKFIGEFQNKQFYKGKEYKYGQIIFEGEYKNNIFFNGKGHQIIDIYTNKKEGFEGIYINGEKQGKEIILDKEGNTLMEKDYKDNKNWKYILHDLINDKVIHGEVIDGNSNYVVDYKIYINRFNEKQVFKYFEGSYRNNDKYLGKEYYENKDIKFEGEFKEGKYYYGKEYYYNRYPFHEKLYLKFEGEFKNGKYYKGKEYFNIDDYLDHISDYEYKFQFKNNDCIKFQGIYKEGKKYIGWEYNLYSDLIFVGEYNSGLYWHGYFYKPQNGFEFFEQKKCGYIRNGNGENITLYNDCGYWEFTGIFVNGEKKHI